MYLCRDQRCLVRCFSRDNICTLLGLQKNIAKTVLLGQIHILRDYFLNYLGLHKTSKFIWHQIMYTKELIVF